MVDIRKFDPEYKQAMDRVIEFDKCYEEMGLCEENKADIDALLETLDDVEESEINLAYLLGMADCLLILDRLQVIQL